MPGPSLLVYTAVIALSVTVASANWGSWGSYTTCSRSCGGGVMYKERQCKAHRSRCVGTNKKYKLCNIKPCPFAEDFRAIQCSKYDEIPLDGVLYTWKPYYDGETCELVCYANGFPFYHKLADTVTDGTMCEQDPQRICVDGLCQTVGCDKNIGSSKLLDTCGVCGGNNSTCSERKTINGVYSTPKLSPGYSTVVEIPENAKDVNIRELGPNNNPLVIWDSSGESYAINPENREPKLIWRMAGCTFRYMASDPDNTYGFIKCKGPTSRKLTVYLVRKSDQNNPGIEYRFNIPKVQSFSHTHSDNTPSLHGNRVEPEQTHTDVDNVQEPRIAGPAITNIKVRHNYKEIKASEDVKIEAPKILAISTSHITRDRKYLQRGIETNNRPNKYRDTSKSRKTINVPNRRKLVYQNGIQVIDDKNSLQELTQKAITGGPKPAALVDRERENIVDRERQKDLRGQSPTARTEDQAHRYQWAYGHWTECSKQCGTGVQRRVVSCVDREQRTTTDSAWCRSHPRPEAQQSCNNGDCQLDAPSSYVRWQVGAWGTCSRTCDLGEQVQEVFCESVLEDERTVPVDDEMCLREYHAKPQYRRSCNDGVSCAAWKITPWSRCSVSCGEGYQLRSVDCRERTSVLPPQSCDQRTKPPATQSCIRSPCPGTSRRRRPACASSSYGCCPDGVTPARGPRNRGCKKKYKDRR